MKPQFLDGPNGRIAYRQQLAKNAKALPLKGSGGRVAEKDQNKTLEAGVVWLGGFRSDMTGTKAERLAQWADETGRGYIRFDYSGHGESEGVFEEGTISDWYADALAVIDTLTEGPLILVGSSMGGWIATLAARDRPERVVGLVLIAPAPDFTEDLMWAQMDAATKTRLLQEGRLEEPSEYDDEPTVITLKLIEDGRQHRLLPGPIPFTGPVRILQGMADPDVPWQHAMRLAQALTTDDCQVLLSKIGDHRLSTPDDLEHLTMAVESLV